jgi:BirA family biotin operon repressor/biotin-[acetyl-CoA-carboxylase] ligase
MRQEPNIHRIHLTETDSTNRYARELPTPCGLTLITTDHQTAGRGQRSNSWESERGKNLLFTLTLPPSDIAASEQFVLCEIISVAICEVLSTYTPDIRIKWPNDIYHRDHKLCGILIEHDIEGSRLARSIIGIGLNVNQTTFLSDAPNPISLRQILGHEIDRTELLTAICQAFTHPTTLDATTLHTRYTALLYRLGMNATYRDALGTFTATLHHVEPDGRLILIDEQGTPRSYLFKEVAYVI